MLVRIISTVLISLWYAVSLPKRLFHLFLCHGLHIHFDELVILGDKHDHWTRGYLGYRCKHCGTVTERYSSTGTHSDECLALPGDRCICYDPRGKNE